MHFHDSDTGLEVLADSKAIFRRNLKLLMRLRGLNNVQLAKALTEAGVEKSDSVISQWKSGVSGPDLVTLGVLADVLEVPVRALFEDPDDDRQSPKMKRDPAEEAIMTLAAQLGMRVKITHRDS